MKIFQNHHSMRNNSVSAPLISQIKHNNSSYLISANMKKQIIALFVLCICFVMPALAQNKVTGTIVEEANGKAIPFVNVGLFRQADSVRKIC